MSRGQKKRVARTISHGRAAKSGKTRSPGTAAFPLRCLMAICLRHFFAFLGWLGAILILYSAGSVATGQTWPPLEKWAGPISSLLTVLAALIMATSIYYPSTNIHPPDKFSQIISAPIVIAGCLIAVSIWVFYGDLPTAVVNGFALLGLSGGFFRLQRKPEDY